MEGLVALITGAISLITLIVFFYMGSNISAIKAELEVLKGRRREDLRFNARVKYYKGLSLGNDAEAIDNLTYVFMHELLSVPMKNAKARYEELKPIYTEFYQRLNKEVPPYPFKD